MKIAVMQPYFFPYLGYFQLINYADIFVNLDHVSFMKGSYMTRNTLKNNIPINIGVIRASQNKSCKETYVDQSEYWISKFQRKIELNYKKSPFFDGVSELILNPWIEFLKSREMMSISAVNRFSTQRIMEYLDISTQYIDSSDGLTHNQSAQGQIDIVKYFNGSTYINPIGGKELYKKSYFQEFNLGLEFVEMNQNSLPDSNLSILHHLFTQQKKVVQHALNTYKIV